MSLKQHLIIIGFWFSMYIWLIIFAHFIIYIYQYV